MITPLLLNTKLGQGGSGIAVSRLHSALLQNGVNSHVMCSCSFTYEKNIHIIKPPITSKLKNYVGQSILSLHSQTEDSLDGISSISLLPTRLNSYISRINPSIAHFHWINGGFSSLSDIRFCNYPKIWTFHDMWPLLGSKHYDIAHGIQEPKLDLLIKTVKRKLIPKALNVICPSSWLATQVLALAPKLNLQTHVVPNIIPEDLFFPQDKADSKMLLGINPDTPTVLFSAHAGSSDRRKGWKYLIESLEYLKELQSELTLIVLGGCNTKELEKLPFDIINAGFISDPCKQNIIYNAADVTLCPSLIDNLPQVATESVQCGTPVVSFRVGGMPDIVTDNITGFMAEPYDTKQLAYLTHKILTMSPLQKHNLSQHCITSAKHKWSTSKLISTHLDLYATVIEQHSNK